MRSAKNPTASRAQLRLKLPGSTDGQPTAQNPANAAADLAQDLHTFHGLSLIPTPAQPGSSAQVADFPLNTEVQDCEPTGAQPDPGAQVAAFPLNTEVQRCETVNNRNFIAEKQGYNVLIGAYHTVTFSFTLANIPGMVFLNEVANTSQPDEVPSLNITDNFNHMLKYRAVGNGTYTGEHFYIPFNKLLQKIDQNSYGPWMGTTYYGILPPNLNSAEHSDLIHAFTHSLCLSGVRYMATQAAQALATHWPQVQVKNMLDAGFGIGRHHPLLRHVFPDTEKITAVDCQHYYPDSQNSTVSIKQVKALLHENDEYVIDYAESYGIPEGTDLILIRNLEVNTAPGAWASFFEQAQNNTSWKALLVSCSSTAIFDIDLQKLISTHFGTDQFECIHCAENPEAQRIYVNWNEPVTQGKSKQQQVKHTIGPDAFCAIIVRKNLHKTSNKTQAGRQANPANQAGSSTTGLRLKKPTGFSQT